MRAADMHRVTAVSAVRFVLPDFQSSTFTEGSKAYGQNPSKLWNARTRHRKRP